MQKKVYKINLIAMLIIVILIQTMLPILSVVIETYWTIISNATNETWDVSKNRDGNVITELDES